MGIFPPSETRDSKDAWDTAQSSYSPERFYTRSTNSHDHSVNRQVKLSPGLDAVCHYAVETVPEYRTVQDVIRDALVHRLHEIDSWPDDHPAFAKLLTETRQAQLDKITAQRKDWRLVISTLDDTLGMLITDGEYEEADELIALNSDEGFEMSPVYQARLAEVIGRRREQLMVAARRHLSVVPGVVPGVSGSRG